MNKLKPSWYSVEGQGFLADIFNLLHPPYTLWHLSYIVIGIALAPQIYLGRSISVLFAFFLGLGIGAHALDETMGNPLQTRLSKRQLYIIGLGSIALATSIGIYYVLVLSFWLSPLLVAELFFVLVYNLEIFKKRFHNTLIFAVSWGAIPFFTGYFVNALSIDPTSVLMAVAIGLLTVVQRTLSLQSRTLRRKLNNVEGLRLHTGEILPLSSNDLARPAETSLKVLTIVIFLVAFALALHRVF